MNKKLYIYQLISGSFFIFILFDLMGYIQNIEIGFYAFFGIILIIHGVTKLHIIPFLKEKIYMLKNFIKKIFLKINELFYKKNKKSKSNRKNKCYNEIKKNIVKNNTKISKKKS